MCDDFNTAGAIGAVFDLIRSANTSLGQPGGIDYEAVSEAAAFLRTVDEVMGVLRIDEIEEENDAKTREIDALIAERDEARRSKNFTRSDEIRDDLQRRGILLEDTPMGTRWKRLDN